MPKTIRKKGQKVVTEQYLDNRLKRFATKENIQKAIKASEKRIISAVKTMMEV